MTGRTDTAPAPDWSVDGDLVATVERTAYVQGWWWGFASGLICGVCSASLLGLLMWLINRALECQAC